MHRGGHRRGGVAQSLNVSTTFLNNTTVVAEDREEEDAEEQHNLRYFTRDEESEQNIPQRRRTTYKARKNPLVLVGPSGAGKSTLVKHLLAKNPEAFHFSVSSTTREPRAGEVDGTHYHFVRTKDDFLAEVAAGNFLEH